MDTTIVVDLLFHSVQRRARGGDSLINQGKALMKTHSVHAVRRMIVASTFGSLMLVAAPAFAAADPDPSAQSTVSQDNATPTAGAPAASTTPATPPAEAPHASAAGHRDVNIESRIKGLHDKLKITKDEEAQWAPVAQVMRDNAAATRAAFKERDDKKATMTAVDDIRSFQAITADRAQGLQKLADAFAPLYAAMPSPQQKIADAVFGHKADNAGKTHAR